MIIFTPNTVIKSADVNLNFSMFNALTTVSWQINNGTAARSAPSGSQADIAGSSYTYTPTQNVTAYVVMSCMIIAISGVTRAYINVNGTNVPAGMYFDANHWQIQTLEHCFNIDANVATTIKGRWDTTGSGSLCNSNTDSIYPSYFRMIILPRS